ncbi:copper-binding protein [Actimicrobium antarcticum]|uniref:Copper-binding protein n=1 Tax=Actimicrobium antarcticum TaxID=1051899 RepID=A0ABP7SIG0_9BURK
MKKLNKLIASLVVVAALPLAAFAADNSTVKTAPAAAVATVASNDAMSDGEVKKVDIEAGKITIKHGPLANLDMPGMTMVFRVKDSAMLDTVKSGDKVKFVAEKVGGALTVTTIQPAK